MGSIKLKIVFSAGAVCISEDGRPWLLQDGGYRRLVWRVLTGLPSVRIYGEWKSVRTLAREKRNLDLQEIHVDSDTFQEAAPQENEILNRLILECLLNGYFKKVAHRGHKINWLLFRLQERQNAMKRFRVKVPVPVQETRVITFLGLERTGTY